MSDKDPMPLQNLALLCAAGLICWVILLSILDLFLW